MKTFKDALTYRFDPYSPPVPRSARPLAALFNYAPRDSMTALLRKAGPFIAERDAYQFTNGDPAWPITDADAQIIVQHYQGVLDVVSAVGVQALRTSLSGISLSAPVLGTVSLPAAVIDWVISQIASGWINQFTQDVISSVPGKYGRCGGMAFSCYDFFQVGQPVAQFDVQPGSGPLRNFIWSRLLDSLDANGATFLEWVMVIAYLPVLSVAASAALGAAAGMVGGPLGAAIGAIASGGSDLLGLGGAKALLGPSKDNWTKLQGKLATEAAWPIGVVYSGKPIPTDQHQLLAIGQTDFGNGTVALQVWDNNVGAQWDLMEIDFRGKELSVNASDPGLNDVKGIICEDYSFQTPPAALLTRRPLP